MSRPPDPETIDLAGEQVFQLAGLAVRPATLEVLAGDRREVLEPRVMQVLVALAHKRGEMVSRDELIRLCWGGRIVGEDAITRCLARLRKLAQIHGGFEIETVPRVGVRLVELSPAAGTPPRRRYRRWSLVAAVMAVLGGVGVGVWLWSHSLSIQANPDRHISVQIFRVIGDQPETRRFAAGLADQIGGVLGENAIGLAQQGPAEAADMVLGGTVAREGDVWRVRAYLQDVPTKLTLWSAQFTAPVREEAALRDQVAVRLTKVAFISAEPSLQKGLKIDPGTLALYIAASDEFTEARTGDALRPTRLVEQVVARAPNFAAAHAMRALNLANASRSVVPRERTTLQSEAKEEAERAIRIDPSAGGAGAYDALYMMQRLNAPLDLVSAEDATLKGIAASPDFPWGNMRECRFLLEVGRARDALRYCEQARATRPLTPPVDGAYANALYAVGDLQRAVRAANESVRFHPDHLQSLRIQWEIAAFDGSPDYAIALLHSFARLNAVRAQDIEAAELFQKARKSGSRADIDRAIAALWAVSRRPEYDRRYLILGAAELGRLDDAFRALNQFGATPPPSGVGVVPGVLLEPAAAPLWRDPRFWPIAAKAGYVRYWQARGKWPDFCSDPTLPFDCRKEAAKVGGA
jgi:DNA-binding winged helix-turn-helix (wHTH) protein/tetratricopeptide (TPR) repeat protein